MKIKKRIKFRKIIIVIVNNNDKNYNWTLLIPLSAGIVFIFSLFKKRG